MNEEQNKWAVDSENIACLFSFPFPIYVDRESTFSVLEERVNGINIRIYPFFRSAPANFNYSPAIKISTIPKPNNRNELINSKNDFLPSLAIILAISGEPNSSAICTWGESWGEGGEQLRYFPMDSIRLDVLSTDPKSHAQASTILSKFLRYIRVETQQWWIGLSLPSRKESYLRHTAPISRKGIFKGEPVGNNAFKTFGGDEIAVDSKLWHRAIRALKDKEEIPDYKDLLLDAKYHSAKGEHRRVVLDLAGACEQACESVFIKIIAYQKESESLNGKEIKPFRRGRYYTGNDLRNHLSNDLYKISGSSLKIDELEIYQKIERLWLLRGDLAHGREQIISQKEISDLIKSTEDCIHWLEKVLEKVISK